MNKYTVRCLFIGNRAGLVVVVRGGNNWNFFQGKSYFCSLAEIKKDINGWRTGGNGRIHRCKLEKIPFFSVWKEGRMDGKKEGRMEIHTVKSSGCSR